VHVPQLVVHGFRNAGDVDLRYLNFHAPGSGFADYMRARRDGREGSFDQEDPPADGGRSPELVRIGEVKLVMDEIEIHERQLEPGAALQTLTVRRLLCLYVLEGALALTDDERAEAGTWVRLAEPRVLACARAGPVRFLEIHV